MPFPARTKKYGMPIFIQKNFNNIEKLILQSLIKIKKRRERDNK